MTTGREKGIISSADAVKQPLGHSSSVPVARPLTSQDLDVRRASMYSVAIRVAFFVLTAALSIRGVYWFNERGADTTPRATQRVVQVHLLPQLQADPTVPGVSTSRQEVPGREAPGQETLKQTSKQEKPGRDAPLDDLGLTDNRPSDLETASVSPTQHDIGDPSTRSMRPSATADRIAKAFQQALLQRVARVQFYPSEARRNGLRGSVGTMFTLHRDGTVKAVWVEKGSGQTVLDTAAIETIERAQPFPRIPDGLPDMMNVGIVIAFENP